jgi:LCP family protein required for cell wall assembly
MIRGRNRQDRPPRVGAAMLAKALAGVLVIMVCSGAASAGAGWFQFDKVVAGPAPGPNATPTPTPIPVPPLPIPKPGGPRTLLILGSDRRAKNSADGLAGASEQPHSDTIVLMRLDPSRNRIAVLSLPRDLAVTIPGYGDDTKINQAYDVGGAAKTLATVKYLFETATGRDFPINSVIDVDFNGFQRAVNYVHGVYVDVDRHYYNPNGTGYSAIDIQPGYQRLVGSDALAYVRYRHEDSDIYRNARQQSFLRQAADQPAVRNLKSLSKAGTLVRTFRQYFRFDAKFLSKKNLFGLLKTAVYLAAKHAPVNQIKLDGITESADPVKDTRLYLSDANLATAYNEFMTGAGTRNPKASKKVHKVSRHAARTTRVTGLENAKALGQDLAVQADSKLSFPFYYPVLRTNGSRYPTDTPRIYKLADEQGKRHNAYRLVIAAGAPGEFYGVQGMTWMNPPLVANPDRVRQSGGRKQLLFYDGSHLRMVAWRTPRALYWVTNTLDYSISNARLLAIAGSLTRNGQ